LLARRALGDVDHPADDTYRLAPAVAHDVGPVEYRGVRPIAAQQAVLVAPRTADAQDGPFDAVPDALARVGRDAFAGPFQGFAQLIRRVAGAARDGTVPADAIRRPIPVPEDGIGGELDQAEQLRIRTRALAQGIVIGRSCS